MPWRAASPMDQRTQFIADYLRDTLSLTELCELYDVSGKTGYKWIDRYLRHGPAGLEELPRRPRRSPNQTSDEIVNAILAARAAASAMGRAETPQAAAPAASAMELAGAIDCERDPEAPWDGAPPTSSAAHRAPREANELDSGSE